MQLKQLASIFFVLSCLFGYTLPSTAGNPNDKTPTICPVEMAGFCDIPADSLLYEAFKFIGTPYRFGGVAPTGFDCSGLVQFVYGRLGIELPRTSRTQAMDGDKIAPSEAKKGDLVFFGKSPSAINHVGIVVSDPGESLKIVHAASSAGVIVTEVFSSKYWAPKFKFIKRIIPFWGDDEPVKQLLGTGSPKSKTNNK
jgi:hypothetical protein